MHLKSQECQIKSRSPFLFALYRPFPNLVPLKVVVDFAVAFSLSERLLKVAHLVEQDLSYFSAHASHWIKSKWQASLWQLTCWSQVAPHWWHLEITSSEIRSPKRSSKTKFLPVNLFCNPFSFACLAYSIIPPSSWYKCSNPLVLKNAVAFSHLIPPQIMPILALRDHQPIQC